MIKSKNKGKDRCFKPFPLLSTTNFPETQFLTKSRKSQAKLRNYKQNQGVASKIKELHTKSWNHGIRNNSVWLRIT